MKLCLILLSVFFLFLAETLFDLVYLNVSICKLFHNFNYYLFFNTVDQFLQKNKWFGI